MPQESALALLPAPPQGWPCILQGQALFDKLNNNEAHHSAPRNFNLLVGLGVLPGVFSVWQANARLADM